MIWLTPSEFHSPYPNRSRKATLLCESLRSSMSHLPKVILTSVLLLSSQSHYQKVTLTFEYRSPSTNLSQKAIQTYGFPSAFQKSSYPSGRKFR